MGRYALLIEYDGGPFAGWQWQDGRPSVQGAVEAALRALEPDVGRIVAAGRTDAGVHAVGQVAHVDLGKTWHPVRLRDAVNWHLRPAPVAVVAVARVAEGFSARFSAVGRRYLYRLVARRAPVVHDRGRVWRVAGPLDVAAMREGAAHLVGTHDFTTFRAAQCQSASPVKTLDSLEIEEREYPAGREVRLRFAARSFLHNQVRSMVGTLERVGARAWAPGRVAEALAARDRAECGPVAPPEGLCLSGAEYGEALGWEGVTAVGKWEGEQGFTG
jgi:tRNA pseudouridine38-40 synthase